MDQGGTIGNVTWNAAVAAADKPLEIGFPPESIQAIALQTYSATGGGNLSFTEIEVFAP